MSLNKFQPHVFVIPEDRADEEIANGFLMHDNVDLRRVKVLPCADGWNGVLKKLETEYVTYLRTYQSGYVVLLIDFDGNYEARRKLFEERTPADLRNRVFVIGAKETPEQLRQALGKNWEQIGTSLADDCFKEVIGVWGHQDLMHNEPDRLKMLTLVKSIVFQ